MSQKAPGKAEPSIMNQAEVKDRYFVSYGVFYLMGILANVPCQFFVVANDYWLWKFRDPIFDNSPGSGGPADRTPLQKYFMSSVSVLLQVAPSVFLSVTAWCSSRLPPPERRVGGSLACLSVLFFMNAALAPLNTDSIQNFFFAAALMFALALNACTSIALISLCELVARFPLAHYAALQSGPALCGALAALIRVCTLAVSSSPWLSGLAFFATGGALAVVALAVYTFATHRSDYFVYRVNEVSEVSTVANVKKVREVLRRVRVHLSAVAVAAGGTAVFFPGVIALVVSERTDFGMGGDWAELYFMPVASFLTFHIGDFVGREVAARVLKPKNPWAMLVLACLRLTLLPLLLLCNAQPREHLPVVFDDTVYIILVVLFATSNGFVANVCILTAPDMVEEEDRTLIMVLTLLIASISVAICSCLSMILINVL